MSEKVDKRTWALESKKNAYILLDKAEAVCSRLFSHGNFDEFFRVLITFPGYSAKNLLLIYDQFPKAKILAGLGTWKNIINNPGQMVLKEEWIGGKGISLLAPFTEISEEKVSLTYHEIKVYDISMTNAEYKKEPDAYVKDRFHKNLLSDSLSELISEGYGRRVLYDAKPVRDNILVSARIYDNAIIIDKGLSDSRKLYVLSEALLKLYFEDELSRSPSENIKKNISEPYENISISDAGTEENASLSDKEISILIQAAITCLFKKWGAEEKNIPTLLLGSMNFVRERSRNEFLDLLQRAYFELENKIEGRYKKLRADEEEAIFDFSKIFIEDDSLPPF